MASYFDVILFSFIGGVLSLIGGIWLLASKTHAKNFANYATPFAAGALLAAAFLDLLPEAAEQGDIQKTFYGVLAGILTFFLLERFLRWFHHHHEEETDSNNANVPLIIIGDTVHNFIDGIAIAAGFLVSIPSGIIVSIAVAAHEIPQEIGDFGLLLHKGLSRRRVLLVNVASAFATVIAAVIFFGFGTSTLSQLDFILGLTAGFFVYIAVSDIIPSIHKQEDRKIAGPQTLLLLVGVLVVGLVTTSLHRYENNTEQPPQAVQATSDHEH